MAKRSEGTLLRSKGEKSEKLPRSGKRFFGQTRLIEAEEKFCLFCILRFLFGRDAISPIAAVQDNNEKSFTYAISSEAETAAVQIALGTFFLCFGTCLTIGIN